MFIATLILPDYTYVSFISFVHSYVFIRSNAINYAHLHRIFIQYYVSSNFSIFIVYYRENKQPYNITHTLMYVDRKKKHRKNYAPWACACFFFPSPLLSMLDARVSAGVFSLTRAHSTHTQAHMHTPNIVDTLSASSSNMTHTHTNRHTGMLIWYSYHFHGVHPKHQKSIQNKYITQNQRRFSFHSTLDYVRFFFFFNSFIL